MTPIGDMVERMLSGGIPPEFIVLAVRTAEQHGDIVRQSRDIVRQSYDNPDTVAERKRAYDRERMREKRGAVEESYDSRTTETENALSISSSLSESQSSEEVDEKKVIKKEKRARGEKLPAEWKPSESHYRDATERGLSATDVDALADEMRGWSQAEDHRSVARKSNWDMAFSGWIRREAKQRRSRGPPPNGHTSGKEQRKQAWEDARRKLDDYLESGGGEGGENPLRAVAAIGRG